MPALAAAALAIGCAMAPVASAAGSSCDAVYNAGIKAVQTAHHLYSTNTKRGGQARTSEWISPGGAFTYANVNGTWTRRPSSVKDELEIARDKLKTHSDTCTVIGDQTAGSQAVTAYKVHADEGGVDSLVRVLKSNGLLEGQTLTLPDGSIIETRYDYSNVEPPAGVK